MVPTWIGMLLSVIGFALLAFGSLEAMLALVLFASLLGGSAAIALPALGGSTIPPAYLALGFLGLKVCVSGPSTGPLLLKAFKANWALVIFSVYSVVTAELLPRLFIGRMEVVPLQAPHTQFLFQTTPLKPTSQNITTAVYLVGTLGAAVLAFFVGARDGKAQRHDSILILTVALTWGLVATGVIVLGLMITGHSNLVEIIRNGAYAQLEHHYEGFERITGFFPEASTFSAYGVALLFVITEAWLRDLRPKMTGPATAALTLILIFSTSSTSYISIALYALILLSRIALFPAALPRGKVVKIFIFLFASVALSVTAAAVIPRLFQALTGMIQHMTIDKANTMSGQQRKFWAAQGFSAFKVSYGLGIGAGSFRSSSIVTAILGSSGVVGITVFTIYLTQLFQAGSG